jgi:hypothetical protein
LIAEKALAEADGKLSRKFMAKMEQAGVSGEVHTVKCAAVRATC